MKFIHKEKGLEFETDNENLFSMLEREGYTPSEEENDEELAELRKQAKELGIKSTHSMKKETLIAKIAELTK